ncbi:MAG: hypothetical protein GX032_04195 [Tenericutes bacterium]|nr:hypothetical protein [Mycoplasmatota bacterium]
MEILSKNLVRNEYLEKRIGTICSYNASKMEVIEGHIINVKKTNVSFIEPHKIIITTKEYKLLIIYYDKDNMFLYNRRMPIDIRKFETLLKHIRNEVL